MAAAAAPPEEAPQRLTDLIAGLSNQLNAISQRLDKGLAEVNGRISALEGTVRQVEGTVRQMEGAVRQVEGAVRQMDGKLDIALAKLVNSTVCADLGGVLVEVPALRRVDGFLRAERPTANGVAVPTRMDQLLVAENEGHLGGQGGTVGWNLDKSRALLTFYTDCARSLEPEPEHEPDPEPAPVAGV